MIPSKKWVGYYIFKILIRAFVGGHSGNQNAILSSALGEVYAERKSLLDITIEKLTVDDIKSKRWSPEDFVDWLTGKGEIKVIVLHLIGAHINQGLDALCWDMRELGIQYSRLKGMIGFPAGAECPVFLQNKGAYLFAQDEKDILETVLLPMPIVETTISVEEGGEDDEIDHVQLPNSDTEKIERYKFYHCYNENAILTSIKTILLIK